MKVLVGYPDASAEQGILARTVAGFEADRPATYGVTRVTDAAGLERLRTAAGSVRVEPQIAAYITAVVRGTREAASLTLGASPRAAESLLKAARAAALLGDLALAAAVWLDALLAPQAGPRPCHQVSVREAPPAFSVGRLGELTYRWRNGAPRPARLRLREVRPDLLGGAQPPRWIDFPARGEARETVPVNPARRGRQRGGGFVLDSVGPLGLGLRRERITLPWEVAVYPPLVTVRLQASLARAQRRREQG